MTPFVKHVTGKLAVPIAAILFTSLSLIVLFEYLIVGKIGNDFGVYWRTANSPAEIAYFWPGRFPFPYAPTMLLWISPLAIIPKWPAYVLFGLCSTVALVAACRPYLSRKATALVLLSPPFARGLFTGQVTALLSAILIWACGSRNRIASGAAFGVIASVKPQLVIMAPLMLALNRDWKAFVSAAFTFAGIVILSLAIFGTERWPEWIASMDHFHNAVTGTNVIKSAITPASLAVLYGLNPLPFLFLGTLVGGAIVYLCRHMGPLEQASAIAFGSLMAAPYALAYDLTALMPLVALAIVRGNLLAVPAGSVTMPFLIFIPIYELLRGKPPRSGTARNSSRGYAMGSVLESRSGP